MIRNYFKTAWRNLRKQKMYSVVKIGGFALSIAACLLIALYIRNELSYDKEWFNADRIYRVTGEYDNNGKLETGADWPAPMANALREDYPEIEKSGRLMPHPLFYCAGSNQVRRTDAEQNTYEDGFTYADEDILNILGITMIYGKREQALTEPHSMVISKSIADKYFPGQNPLGKTMILNNDKDRIYTIGGVIKDFPLTSHLHYDFLLSLSGYELWDKEQTTWGASNYPTYILVKPGTDREKLEAKLKGILTKYYLPMMKENGGPEVDNFVKKARILIQPVSRVHLYSADIDDGIQKGDIRFVRLFGAIACFIVLIACINFINLSTAKSANRAKEVGLRKVVGSQRRHLINQFLVESVLFSLLSIVLGVIIAITMLPLFNGLAAKSLTIPWSAWWLFPLVAASALVIGIVAGLYPSLYLSSFKPIQVLKGKLSKGSRNAALRNGLVVFQFSASIILIIGTLVIFAQTHFILNKKVGFNKDQVLMIQGTNTLEDNRQAFRNELLKASDIKNASISDYLPIAGTKRDGNTFYNEGKRKEEIGVFTQKWQVDQEYLETLGLKMTAGRYFRSDMPSDSGATVVNETMVKELGLKDPIGKKIENGWQLFTIIGVVKDFNFESMRQKVSSLCLVLSKNNSTIISAKISGTDVKRTISYISSVWKQFSPNQPLRYTFMDESFANMYADVQRTGNIFTSFAVLAVIIACLGLFALSAFMAEQRTKEIGIRKVLGASIRGITAMLSKDFVKLVLLSILIAAPVAWWAMNKWLQDFAYRISISWWMIAIAGLGAIVIALATISFQSIKAALANPVKSLRTE